MRFYILPLLFAIFGCERQEQPKPPKSLAERIEEERRNSPRPASKREEELPEDAPPSVSEAEKVGRRFANLVQQRADALKGLSDDVGNGIFGGDADREQVELELKRERDAAKRLLGGNADRIINAAMEKYDLVMTLRRQIDLLEASQGYIRKPSPKPPYPPNKPE